MPAKDRLNHLIFIFWKRILLMSFLVSTAILHAQSNISIQCSPLSLSSSQTIDVDPITEDDPGYLPEAYASLLAFYHAGSNKGDQSILLRVPSRVGTYHWTQTSDSDEKNDSLYAYLTYNLDPNVNGHAIQAYPREFTITITRYDDKKDGIVEGKFEGTMETHLAWKNQIVSVSVKGNFKTTRLAKSTGECRKQRKSEKVVTAKAITVFDQAFMKPIKESGWKIEATKGLNSFVAVHPSPFRPVFLCSEFFDLKLSLDPDSDFGKMIQDSLKYYSQQMSKTSGNPKEIRRVGQNIFRLQNLQAAEISIQANSPYLKEDYVIGNKDWSKDLHIPGAAFAWQLYRTPNSDEEVPEEKTMLFFGNWKGANMHSGTYVLYPFTHKQQSPYIENIVVSIKAPVSVANDLIKKINWNQLNEALTK